jgi:hypothetical protein
MKSFCAYKAREAQTGFFSSGISKSSTTPPFSHHSLNFSNFICMPVCHFNIYDEIPEEDIVE